MCSEQQGVTPASACERKSYKDACVWLIFLTHTHTHTVMQPAMKSCVFPFLCLAALFGAASGLIVGPVRLVNNRTYISYGLNASANNSLIECIYHLDEGEQVQRVFWEMWDDVDKLGTYEWRPGSEAKASGKLEGVVNLNRDDGSLELMKLRYDLGGRYSCGVSLTNGATKTTDTVEVLIIDISGISTYKSDGQRCVCSNSYESPAVFPEPTLRAGMFSRTLNRFYDEVSSHEWFKVIHPNDSVTYSYNNASFKIDQNSPDDVVFKVKMGVTKSDGEYIPLGTVSSLVPAWNENGCYDVKEEDNKEVYYFPGDSIACRGGRKNMTKATMTCKKGYQAEGDVSIVVMRCNATSLTWEPEQGHTATFEDLVCGIKSNPGDNGGASSGNPSLVLLSASLFGVVLLLFNFSHP